MAIFNVELIEYEKRNSKEDIKLLGKMNESTVSSFDMHTCNVPTSEDKQYLKHLRVSCYVRGIARDREQLSIQ